MGKRIGWGLLLPAVMLLAAVPGFASGTGTTHRLKVFDLGARSLIWEVDTKHPLMHPPSMAPGVWFTISEFQGWLVFGPP